MRSVHHPGDLAKRIADRRRQLGLSQDEVARRAGMASGYLKYLERSATSQLSTGGLWRLAAALETTPTALRGGDADQPLGVRAVGS